MNVNRFIFFIAVLLLTVSVSAQSSIADTAGEIKGYPAKAYFTLIEEYYAEQNYEAALAICDTVLAYRPHSSEAYRHQADIYFTERNWQKCKSAAQKCLAIDSTSTSALRDYFYAENEDNRGDFVKTYERMWQAGFSSEDMAYFSAKVKTWQNNNVWSYVGMSVLVAGLIAAFFQFYYKDDSSSPQVNTLFRGLSLPYILLVPAAVTCILYLLFFHFSAWIWSGNSHHPTLDYNPYSVRECTFDHDGNEGFVLYGLVLGVLCLSIAVLFALRYAQRRLRLTVFFILTVVFVYYIYRIGFYPPYANLPFVWPMILMYTFLFLLAVWGFNELLQRYPYWQLPLVALLLVPFCFFISAFASIYDYGYSLSPALRLSYGDRIRDIYFQYDVFLSLLALFWLKLKLGIEYIYVLSEVGYYLFFVGLYLFSRKFFSNKRLPLLLLICAFLVRYYANMGPNHIFQISPWRLDMWLVLIVLFYWRGAYHWSIGVFFGWMLIFHRNFGFIYLAAYAELLAVLLIIDLLQARSMRSAMNVIVSHARLSLVNIAIILSAFGGSYLILGGVLPASALAYRKIGIGMMKISGFSFYWYVPVLLGAVILLLLRDRERLTQRYFSTGVFLVLLAIGQSLYFFGRSHEHNILNMSSILILCFFLFLDVLYQSSHSRSAGDLTPRERRKLWIYRALPFLFLMLICFYYAGSIRGYIGSLNLTHHTKIDFQHDFWADQQMTHGSDRIFYLEFGNDFLYYYHGHHKPVGYFTPNDAWVLNKDMAIMLQGLLDSSYYIVPTNVWYADEVMRLLDFNAYDQQGWSQVYYKRPYENILPDRHSIVHRSFITALPERGVDVPAFSLGGDFTVQCIIRPDTTMQHDSVCIFSDLHSTLGYQGMQLYCADTQRSEYVFQYGAGRYLYGTSPFVLRPGALSYIAITTGDSSVSVYVNGTLSSQGRYRGDYMSSDRPFIFGNNRARMHEGRFKGRIYEIQIDSARISGDEVIRTQAAISLKADSSGIYK